MKDFTEIAQSGQKYGLFLIRKTQGLNAQFFNSIHSDLLQLRLVISFERLFKGKKSALVVFGPRKLLFNYHNSLDLLELEDYTNINAENISAWEIAIKDNGKVFSNLPPMLETEQFWCQLVLWADKKEAELTSFLGQIRAVLVSTDVVRNKTLTHSLQNLAPDRLFKLPKDLSNEQILDFYQKRVFRKEQKPPLHLNSDEISKFLIL